MVRNCGISMETTLYDEQLYHRIGNDMNHVKRNLTLDLNPMKNQAKKMRYNPDITAAPVLSSPDIHMLKVGTPELEKLIMQNVMTTQTPTPTQILFPKTVTEEQEQYARGFEEALNDLHNGDSSQGLMLAQDIPITTAGNGMTYLNLDQTNHSGLHLSSSFLDHDTIIKDEPQTVPSIENTPPMSPIDMETQEKIKLERKRQRNRLAASKCRRRKLERILRLEDKVKLLKGENAELSTVINKLKEHVCHLKEQVMEHVEAGCQIVLAPQF